MIALSLPVLTILAVALVTGTEVCEGPAEPKNHETGRAEDIPPARDGLEMNEPAEGKYAIVNGLKIYQKLLPPIAAFLNAPLPGDHGQAVLLSAGNKP
jgi:hypothetical protein